MTLVRNQDIGWLLPTLSPVLVVPPQFLVHNHSRNGAMHLVLLLFFFLFSQVIHIVSMTLIHHFFLFWRQDPHATFLFGAFPVSLSGVHPLLCIIFHFLLLCLVCVGVMYICGDRVGRSMIFHCVCHKFVTSFNSYVKLDLCQTDNFFFFFFTPVVR